MFKELGRKKNLLIEKGIGFMYLLVISGINFIIIILLSEFFWEIRHY